MIDALLAEETVAGCILVDAPGTLPLIRGIVSAGDFAGTNTKAVFRAACELADEGLPVDPVTIQARAAETGTALSSEWVRASMQTFTTTASVAANADVVHRAAIEREALAVGEDLTDGHLSPEEALARLQSVLDGQRATIPTPQEAAKQFYNRLLKASEGELQSCLPTGFPALDAVLGGGLAIPGLTTLAARPSVGKTAVGLAIASNVARSGGRVLYISLEMSSDQLWARLLASRTGISATQLQSGDIREGSTWTLINRGVTELAGEPLMIWDKPCTMDDIELRTRSASPLDLLVVDHVGIVRNNRGDTRQPYVIATEKSHRLQQLAKATGVPVLMLCQLNRGVEGRENKRPRMSDLRDTGAFEEDSDAVLLLSREDYYTHTAKPWDHQTMEINVAKNRHGEVGTVCLDYVAMITTVREMGFREVSDATPFD